MKHRNTIAAATLFAASALAAPALAGGLSVGADAGVSAGTGVSGGIGSGGLSADAGVSAGADADATTQAGGAGAGVSGETTASTGVDFNTALSAIGDESSAATLRTMTDVGAVTVVDVSETANADATALESAVEANATKIEEMRASLQSNAAVNAALEAEEVDVSQVIAADVAADGSLTVFVE